MPLWVVGWNLMLSHSVPPWTWITPLSSVSSLHAPHLLVTWWPSWLSDLVCVSVCVCVCVCEREREREREPEHEHSHINFITVYCCNFLFLSIIVVNLLMYQIHKLNFIIGMYRKKNSIYRVQDYLWFPASTWNISPVDKEVGTAASSRCCLPPLIYRLHLCPIGPGFGLPLTTTLPSLFPSWVEPLSLTLLCIKVSKETFVLCGQLACFFSFISLKSQ